MEKENIEYSVSITSYKDYYRYTLIPKDNFNHEDNYQCNCKPVLKKIKGVAPIALDGKINIRNFLPSDYNTSLYEASIKTGVEGASIKIKVFASIHNYATVSFNKEL